MQAKTRILIADDDRDVRELLQVQLEREGCVVLAVEDGQQLMERLDEFAPDLLIVDLLMPNVNGLEICRRVRESDGPFHDVPILMVSALEEREHLQMAFWAGADDYLPKPFTRLDLVLRVSSLLLIRDLEDHVRRIGAPVERASLRRLRSAWMEVVRGPKPHSTPTA